MWRPEVKHGCHFSGAIHLGFCFVCFETGSLLVLELAGRVGWAGWPASLRDPPISTSPALRLHVHNHIQVFFMWVLIVQLRALMDSEHSAGSPASHFLSLKDGSNPVSLDPNSTTELVLEPYKPVSHFFPS